MKNNHSTIIDCFTQLMVYTLEFDENAQSDIYTIEKLVADYETLIAQAQSSFEEKKIDVDFYEALFPIIAWVDEMILSSSYKQKREWRKNLLQKKFFNISNAGYEFYERLNALDKNAFDLRLLYLYCLFLGFKGRYYRNEDAESLDAVFEKEKSLAADDFSDHFPPLAFKDAYAQDPILKKKKFEASYTGVWILIGVSLFVGMILFVVLQTHLNGLLDRYNVF
jgi:type VI secretion system protein ImpK